MKLIREVWAEVRRCAHEIREAVHWLREPAEDPLWQEHPDR